MKRLLIVMMVCVALCLQIEVMADGDVFESYTKEQLIEAYNDIGSRLLHDEIGSTMYDDNGIVVSWKGVEYQRYDGNDFSCKANLLITNNTGADISVDLPTIAVNGFIISLTNSWYQKIENGLSLLTGTYHSWLIGKDDLSSYGITEFKTIFISLDIYKLVDGEREKYLNIPLEISTDIPVGY